MVRGCTLQDKMPPLVPCFVVILMDTESTTNWYFPCHFCNSFTMCCLQYDCKQKIKVVSITEYIHSPLVVLKNKTNNCLLLSLGCCSRFQAFISPLIALVYAYGCIPAWGTGKRTGEGSLRSGAFSRAANLATGSPTPMISPSDRYLVHYFRAPWNGRAAIGDDMTQPA